MLGDRAKGGISRTCSPQPRIDVRREIVLDVAALRCASREEVQVLQAVDVPDAGSGVKIVSCTCG